MENPSVKWGLIAGLGVMITSLVLYLVDVRFFLSLSNYFLGWVVYAVCMVLAVRDQQAIQNGFISFKEAFSSAFIAHVLASLMYFIFFYLMFNFIDTGLSDVQIEMSKETAESWLRWFGVEDAEIEDVLTELELQGADVGVSRTIFEYVLNLIIPGALMSAIVAAIMKKENPSTGIV